MYDGLSIKKDDLNHITEFFFFKLKNCIFRAFRFSVRMFNFALDFNRSGYVLP
jgi:hypothetical protein